MASFHIGIAGNIGSGKSTLAEYLKAINFHKHLGQPEIRIFRESIASNPYLPLYYQDPRRWAYESQMSFLQQRLQQQELIRFFDGVAVEDRTALEDRWVFAASLHEQRILDELGFSNYLFWYRVVFRNLRIPHVLVYLRVDEPDLLLGRIAKRGRGIETGITKEYLEALGAKYDSFIRNYEAIIDGHLEKPHNAGVLEIDAAQDFDSDNPHFLEDAALQIRHRLEEMRLLPRRAEKPLSQFKT
jgi:deoxyadenosine/deoxycytidine kinase